MINDLFKKYPNNPILYSVWSMHENGEPEQKCILILIETLINSLDSITEDFRSHLQRCGYIAPIKIPKNARLIK